MPKKKSLKAPVKVQENSTVEEGKPPPSKQKKLDTVEPPSKQQKKLGSEIDEIFSGKKRKKTEVKKSEVQDSENEKLSKMKKKNEKGSKDDIFGDSSSRSKKRIEDGLVVYTEEELGINNGDAGGTPLCPFDCSCCF